MKCAFGTIFFKRQQYLSTNCRPQNLSKLTIRQFHILFAKCDVLVPILLIGVEFTTQEMHGLTRLPNLSNVPLQGKHQSKLTYCGATKKMSLNSHSVRAKEKKTDEPSAFIWVVTQSEARPKVIKLFSSSPEMEDILTWRLWRTSNRTIVPTKVTKV